MIDINNESGQTADELGLVRLATFALAELRIHPQSDLSILLVDRHRLPEPLGQVVCLDHRPFLPC